MLGLEAAASFDKDWSPAWRSVMMAEAAPVKRQDDGMGVGQEDSLAAVQCSARLAAGVGATAGTILLLLILTTSAQYL
jgi:hypothetical protein